MLHRRFWVSTSLISTRVAYVVGVDMPSNDEIRNSPRIGEIEGDQPTLEECYINSPSRRSQGRTLSIHTNADPKEERSHPSPMEELIEVESDGIERVVNIVATLPLEQSKALTELVRNFKQMFDWSANSISGITTSANTHELNSDPRVKPIGQRKKEDHG